MSQSKGKRSKTTCDGIRNVEASQRHIEFDRNGTLCGDNANKFMSFISRSSVVYLKRMEGYKIVRKSYLRFEKIKLFR
jgi:hypothetical protein